MHGPSNMNYSKLKMEIAREAFRKRIMEENSKFNRLGSDSEGRAKSRTAKERHAELLEALKGPVDIPLRVEEINRSSLI